jgi:hypothetical protein
MSDLASKITTRHGAGVFEKRQLIGPQAEAYAKALSILAALDAEATAHAQRRAPSSADETLFDSIVQRFDRARPSQVILFDAGRGAGKSSLLFTLCDEAAKAFRATAAGSAATDEVATALAHYIPLQLLDVQPLPTSKPLLAYLLLALNDLRQKIGGATDLDDESWIPSARGEHLRHLDTAWNRLCLSVNAFDRATQGDGDALVAAKMALEQAEAAGTVNQRFERFVDELVKQVQRDFHLRFAPMLLIPIDDADMNAELSHQCIEMLRMLFHRQVVFAITGHSELFLARLQQQGYRAFDGLDDASRQLHARRWAFELYDRVIPPARRCAIEPLDPRDRALLTITHGHLGESLASVLRWPSEPPTLMSGITPHLFVPRATEDAASGADRALAGAAALPDRLRALINLREQLAALRDARRNAKLSPVTAAEYAIRQAELLWLDATTARFTNTEEGVVRSIFRRTGPGGSPELDLRSIEWNVSHRPLAHIGDRRNSTLALFASRTDGAAIRIGAERKVPLDERQHAALSLLIDVIEEHSPNSAQFSEMPFARERPRFVLANVRDRENKEHSIPWPIPDWQSRAPFDQLSLYWSMLAQSGVFDTYEEEHLAAKYVVRWYFAAVLLVSLPWQLRYQGPWQREQGREWKRLKPLEAWQKKFDEPNEPARNKALREPPTLDELAEVALWMGMSQAEHIEARSSVVAAFDWLRSRAPMILAIEGGLAPQAIDELDRELRAYIDGLDLAPPPKWLIELHGASDETSQPGWLSTFVTTLKSARTETRASVGGTSASEGLLRLLQGQSAKIRLFRRQWLAEHGLTPERFDDERHPWRGIFEGPAEFDARKVLNDLRQVELAPPERLRFITTFGYLIDSASNVLEDLPPRAREALLRFLRGASDRLWKGNEVIGRLGDVIAIAAREAQYTEVDAKEPAIEIEGVDEPRVSVQRFRFTRTRNESRLEDGASVSQLEWSIPPEDKQRDSIDFLVCLYGDLVANVLGKDPYRGASWLPKVIAWGGWRRPFATAKHRSGLSARLPAPRVPSPGELQDLAEQWNGSVRSLTTSSLCMRAWVASVINTIDRPATYPEFVSQPGSWTALFARAFSEPINRALRDQLDPRVVALAHFRSALPLFAAPERGLAEAEVQEILAASEEHDLFYSSDLAAMRKTLTRFDSDVKKQRPDDLFVAIDATRRRAAQRWRTYTSQTASSARTRSKKPTR